MRILGSDDRSQVEVFSDLKPSPSTYLEVRLDSFSQMLSLCIYLLSFLGGRGRERAGSIPDRHHVSLKVLSQDNEFPIPQNTDGGRLKFLLAESKLGVAMEIYQGPLGKEE